MQVLWLARPSSDPYATSFHHGDSPYVWKIPLACVGKLLSIRGRLVLRRSLLSLRGVYVYTPKPTEIMPEHQFRYVRFWNFCKDSVCGDIGKKINRIQRKGVSSWRHWIKCKSAIDLWHQPSPKPDVVSPEWRQGAHLARVAGHTERVRSMRCSSMCAYTGPIGEKDAAFSPCRR